MPVSMREIVAGNIEGLAELTGITEIKVQRKDDDSGMHWHLSWKGK